jgi:ribonuclease P protein component
MIARRFKVPLKNFPFRTATSVLTPYFSFKIIPNTLAHARYAVIIGVKAEKRAARRNFWKRRILDTLASQNISGFDIVCVVGARVKEITSSVQLNQIITKALTH